MPRQHGGAQQIAASPHRRILRLRVKLTGGSDSQSMEHTSNLWSASSRPRYGRAGAHASCTDTLLAACPFLLGRCRRRALLATPQGAVFIQHVYW